MTCPKWRARKKRELINDRQPLVMKQFAEFRVLTPAERTLLRHLDREIDYYQMQEMRPAFERMERVARERRAVARRITRFVKKV